MSTTEISTHKYVYNRNDFQMNTLYVFVKQENFCINIFLQEHYNEDDVMQVQVMTCVEGKLFIFGLITYRNQKAAIMAMEHFRSIGVFTQRMTLDKSRNKRPSLPIPLKMQELKSEVKDTDFVKPRVAKEKPKVVLDEHFKLQCIDIFEHYQSIKDLDHVINKLAHDSLISENHETFVSSLLLKGLSDGPKVLEEMGTLFVKIIMKKAISIIAINNGINAVLKNWTGHILNFPHFFFYIASFIAPLMLTCRLYDILQLKNALQSTSPKVSSVLIIELLKTTVEYSGEFKNNKEINGIIWLYKKWTISEYTSLDTFLSCEQLNKYFKRDRFGVFFLSISMYDQMKTIQPIKIYSLMREWINHNINKQIIDDPIFVRALTIAAVFLNIKNNISCTKFFNYMTGELLTYYIKSKPFKTSQIQSREVQCLYGIQIAVAVVCNPPQDLAFNLFNCLHRETIVSSGSFKIWKDENQFNAGFIEDQETKKKTLESFDWNDLLIKFASNNCNE